MDLPSPAPSPTFGELLTAARAGSREAQGLLLAKFKSRLLRVASLHRPVNLQAKFGDSDLVQETCLQALQEFCGFNGTGEPQLRAWLQQILARQAQGLIDRFERAQKRNVAREVSLAELDEVTLEKALRDHRLPTQGLSTEDLEQYLRSLPESSRRLLLARFGSDHTMARIAAHTGKSIGAVRKASTRALQILAEGLKPSD